MDCNLCPDKGRCHNNHIYDAITNVYTDCPHRQIEFQGIPRKWKDSTWDDLPEGEVKTFCKRYAQQICEKETTSKTHIIRGKWLQTSQYATCVAKSIGTRTFKFEHFEDTTRNFFDDKDAYRASRDNPHLLILDVKPLASKALPLVLTDLLESRELDNKPTLICLAPGEACKDFFETPNFKIHSLA